MRAILLVVRSNLRRRWAQGLLIGLIMALSALVFFTGVGVLREIDRPLDVMYQRQSGSHLTMVFDTQIHDPDSVRAWWRRQPEVAMVSEATPTVAVLDRSFARGAPLSRFFFVTERPRQPGGPDSLRFVAGTPRWEPGPGEVWIPTSVSLEANLQPGDTLEVPAADGLARLVITGVVVDPVFSTPFNSPVRIWISAGDLSRYFASTALNRVIVGVRFSSPNRSDALWDRFVADLGGAFNGSNYNYRAVRDGYTAPYTYMAVMIVAFSILGFLVALFAIQGTVTSAMLADFRMIGILRTQGFTPRNVRRVYELQYLALAGIAIPVGVGLGIVAVRATVSLLTRTIATPVPAGSLLDLGALTLIGFLGLVYLFVVRVAGAAGRIQPAEAIRAEAREQGGARGPGLTFHRLRSLPVPWLVGIRNLALQKRRAILLTSAIVFATLAASLAVNLDYSFGLMRTNLATFGIDAATVRVSRSGRRLKLRHEDLMTVLRERPGVTAVATWDQIEGQVMLTNGDSTRGRQLLGTAVDGDMDGLGFLNLRGRNPVGPNEIALAVRTAAEAARDVGSSVDVNLMGSRLTFKVVGVYQSLNNTGEGFRVRLPGVQLANPLWTPVEYSVRLADSVAPDRFMADLEAEYGEAVDAKPGDYFLRDQLATVTSGLRMANGFLALVFLAAAAVFIVNTTLLTIGENRRIFGILKTSGMTPAELRTSVVSGVAVQAVAGVVVGLVVWAIAAGAALSFLFSGVGLVDFPLRTSILGMAIAIPVILGFSLIAAWVPSAAVLDINPRSLIVE